MVKTRTFYYKGVPVNIFGLPVVRGKKKSEVLPKRHYLRSFVSGLEEGAPRNLLIIYDIPEGRKKERDWFRRQLINFDFIMIQRSVWVGPAPLPPEFLDYLKRIGLQKEFKTFKLAKAYAH